MRINHQDSFPLAQEGPGVVYEEIQQPGLGASRLWSACRRHKAAPEDFASRSPAPGSKNRGACSRGTRFEEAIEERDPHESLERSQHPGGPTWFQRHSTELQRRISTRIWSGRELAGAEARGGGGWQRDDCRLRGRTSSLKPLSEGQISCYLVGCPGQSRASTFLRMGRGFGRRAGQHRPWNGRCKLQAMMSKEFKSPGTSDRKADTRAVEFGPGYKLTTNSLADTAARSLATVLFLALRIGSPIFLEGASGAGRRTSRPRSQRCWRPHARTAGSFRLFFCQMLEGLGSAPAAVYSGNHADRMIAIRLAEARADVHDRERLSHRRCSPSGFLIKRSCRLAGAWSRPWRVRRCAVSDEGSTAPNEAFEGVPLRRKCFATYFQVTIPELGTV